MPASSATMVSSVAMVHASRTSGALSLKNEEKVMSPAMPKVSDINACPKASTTPRQVSFEKSTLNKKSKPLPEFGKSIELMQNITNSTNSMGIIMEEVRSTPLRTPPSITKKLIPRNTTVSSTLR